MGKPIVGLTCHAIDEPVSRSAVTQQYVDAVLEAGGVPICLPLGMDLEGLRQAFRFVDGLLLPGGDDVAPERYGETRHPKLGKVDEMRDELELSAASLALEEDLPVLGICRGIQVLAVAAGGSLFQDVPTQWESRLPHDVRQHGRDHLCHEIEILPGSRLADALGTTTSMVNSFHHQAVRDLPPRFEATAHASDGIVEAIEARDKTFAVGVQCHPEAMWRSTAPEFAGLFAAFVRAAAGARMLAHR